MNNSNMNNMNNGNMYNMPNNGMPNNMPNNNGMPNNMNNMPSNNVNNQKPKKKSYWGMAFACYGIGMGTFLLMSIINLALSVSSSNGESSLNSSLIFKGIQIGIPMIAIILGTVLIFVAIIMSLANNNKKN